MAKVECRSFRIPIEGNDDIQDIYTTADSFESANETFSYLSTNTTRRRSVVFVLLDAKVRGVFPIYFCYIDTMKVLALDPGYDRLGVAVLERTTENREEVLLFSTCIVTNRDDDLMDRLKDIGDAVSDTISKYTPQIVAIETLFFNKNVKTAIGVAQARGIIVYLAKRAGCSVVEFGPQEIKVAVTGYGKSDKQAVIDMVKRLVKNTPKMAHDDEYDAIAVGLTALAHHRN